MEVLSKESLICKKERLPVYQESPRQTKPKKGQFMNFSRGHSGTKVQFVNRACFPKEKHQNSQKWAKFMNFSFWPFLWFGLPGRLPIVSGTKIQPEVLLTEVFFSLPPGILEDRNLRKLRSPDSSCPSFLSDHSLWGQ